MISNSCLSPGIIITAKLGAFSASYSPSLAYSKKHTQSLTGSARFPSSLTSLRFKSLRLSCHGNNDVFLKGIPALHLPHVSCPSNGSQKLHRQVGIVPRATKSFSYPKITEKPKWWWRSLACIPYLLPIADTLVCASTAFQLHSFLEDLEFVAYPLLDTMAVMPSWFMMALSFCVYLFVVRRKELPHFLRYHVITAMLLGTASQIVAIASDWLPRTVFRGCDLLQRFWITFALVQLFTIFECMRCALSGSYADVPFVSDAAYIHSYIG